MSNFASQINLWIKYWKNVHFLIQEFQAVWGWKIKNYANIEQTPVTHPSLKNLMWNVIWTQTESLWINLTCSTQVQNHSILCFGWALLSCRPWLVLIRKELKDYLRSHSDPWPLTFWIVLSCLLARSWMSKCSATMMLCSSLMESHFYQGSKKPSL